jgi:hypothetical protein
MSDHLVTDPKQIREEILAGGVLGAERVCKACYSRPIKGYVGRRIKSKSAQGICSVCQKKKAEHGVLHYSARAS